MSRQDAVPVALTIAGSDSGGGAGIQADLKTFASLGVHGTSAITCITAQNPITVRAIQPIRPDLVRCQVQAVFDELRPAAVKTGMLYSTAIIRVVADFFSGRRRPPLIVDPVMVATSGASLVKRSAVKAIQTELLPVATLVTPNLDEAGSLLGCRLTSVDDLRAAAREMKARYGCAALVKGGHLSGLKQAVDIFFDGKTELLLTAPFFPAVSTHGTGCTYSAAIAACLALGLELQQAVERAKSYVTHAIAQHAKVHGHCVLNSFWTTRGNERASPARNPRRNTQCRFIVRSR